MIERLVHSLIASENEAADDLLLEALDLGNDIEKRVALGAIVRRSTLHGLSGVVERYEILPGSLKLAILERISDFGAALSECGRSHNSNRRLAAMRLIALGRRGRLGYVLLENLNHGDERLRRAAIEAMVALARWIASETRRVQVYGAQTQAHVADLIEQRDEIEQMIFRALERQKGAGGDLTRAALLLADHAGSHTLRIARLARHRGRIPMERCLAQPPASEHVEAFLLGASHADARPTFAGTFAHIHERPVLDGILRKSHWIKDQKLAVCVQDVMGGKWLDNVSLARDLIRRPPGDVVPIARWINASGCADVVKDALLVRLYQKAKDDAGARLGILRVLASRPREASMNLLKEMLSDSDERICRMAAREIARRRLPGYQGFLMAVVGTAAPSVRRVIGRAAGEAGFRAYWRKYDRLDANVRRAAGRAIVRIVPDVARKFSAMLSNASANDRVRLLQLASETDMVDGLRAAVMRLLDDQDARVRSKAVTTAGNLKPLPEGALIDRVLYDENPRVRANAIEVLESTGESRLVPMLAGRLHVDNNRERANAIKAVQTLSSSVSSDELTGMLRDSRPMHRISALWAVRRLRSWNRLNEVARMARADGDVSVRHYALGVLKSAAEQIHAERSAVA